MECFCLLTELCEKEGCPIASGTFCRWKLPVVVDWRGVGCSPVELERIGVSERWAETLSMLSLIQDEWNKCVQTEIKQ